MACFVRWLGRLDQRFPATQEQEFKQFVKPKFALPIYLATVGVIAGLCRAQYELGIDIDMDDALWLFLTGRNLCVAVLFAAMTSFVAAVRSRCLAAESADFELLCVIGAVFHTVLVGVDSRWHVAVMFHRDPEDTFGDEARGSEGLMVLRMAAITAVTCLVLPIRSHLSWILPLSGICTICIVTAATSSPYNGVLFQEVGNLFFLDCMLRKRPFDAVFRD